MRDSLSILLPVFNVQATLETHVSRLLEVAGDLTGHLEIVVIDNGSGDHTLETAHDLAVKFPQVKTMRCNTRHSFQDLLLSAFARSSGEIIMACRSDRLADLRAPAAIEYLWLLRDRLRAGSTGPGSLMVHSGEWIAINRQAFAAWRRRADQRGPHDRPPRPNFLAKIRDFALGQ